MRTRLLAKTRVERLFTDGVPTDRVAVYFQGISTQTRSDKHWGVTRRLSGHDGEYLRSSGLKKGDEFFNFRTWTGVSTTDLEIIKTSIGVEVPPGILRENFVFSGLSQFSTKFPPTSRIVFPKRGEHQTILAIWGANSPCVGVAKPLADHYCRPELEVEFLRAAVGLRGVIGHVLSGGVVEVGDEAEIWSPVTI